MVLHKNIVNFSRHLSNVLANSFYLWYKYHEQHIKSSCAAKQTKLIQLKCEFNNWDIQLIIMNHEVQPPG